MPDIEIYTQPGCSYCHRAKRLLEHKGVGFREISAPYGTSARQESRSRSGGLTSVPQIFIDGRHIGGCDELYALDGTGGLDPLLRAA